MKINKDLLIKHLEDGYVIKQTHPYLDLQIYNYSQFTQYENKWDEITLMCRGLILDSNFNIIQRPFGKFFNLDEHISEYKPNIPNLPFEVYDKMDGSLGILYWDSLDNSPKIASRGSFTSEQAIEGTKMLYQYRNAFIHLDRKNTYVFEIIFKSNRIVIDYGDRWELVLLAIIDTDTGEDLPLVDIGFPLVERYDGIKDFDKLKLLNLENKEGFVVKYSNGFRLKIKFDEYCRLHRIITNITSYDIWDCLRNGTGFDEILNKVPDEFYEWVKQTKANLNIEFEKIFDHYYNLYIDNIDRFDSHKEFAMWAKQHKYCGLLFSIKNSRWKSVDDAIWKLIKPQYEKPFNSKIIQNN